MTWLADEIRKAEIRKGLYLLLGSALEIRVNRIQDGKNGKTCIAPARHVTVTKQVAIRKIG
jgi:hypothetical protein